MDQVFTPQCNTISRSETMLSPPPLKRPRIGDDSQMLLEVSVTSIPMSLLIPDDLDTPDFYQYKSPRLSLKPRTTLTPSSSPVVKRLVTHLSSSSSDLLLLEHPVDAPRLRMKRRRSSMSSCGVDNFGRFEIKTLMPFV